MECYKKKEICWRSNDGRTGKNFVRCGRCVPCLITSANEWSLRCVLENTLHDSSCCLTLTINEENIDRFSDGVSRVEIQRFLKRLRKSHFVRYFGCAEYGSSKGRPHYHVILFGWIPEDRRFFKKSPSGISIYTSAELSKLWTYGFATVEEFNERTAVYCSKYLNKIKKNPEELTPPFTFMSLKPSIGFCALTEADFERGYIYLKGKKRFLPRSFYQTLKRKGIEYPELSEKRLSYFENQDDDDLFVSEWNSAIKSEILLDKLHSL